MVGKENTVVSYGNKHCTTLHINGDILNKQKQLLRSLIIPARTGVRRDRESRGRVTSQLGTRGRSSHVVSLVT